MLPVLRILADGTDRDRRTLAADVAEALQLTQEERERPLPSGKATYIRSRVGWALTYLKAAAVLQTPKRGWYRLTDRGKAILASPPAKIDAAFLRQYPEFREFLSSSGAGGGATDAAAASPAPGQAPQVISTPDERIEEAYAELRTSIEAELLDTVLNVKPAHFEQIVVDLLVRMGYGGSREEAGRAVGRSGDEGIDGIIDEDRLGLDMIYIQAKRWKGTVGRPEVQKFAGALQGQRAHKGIFITTSDFTKEAMDYVRNINVSIVLIDGVRLASLMFEYDLGVTPRRSLVVKSIDADYFEES